MNGKSEMYLNKPRVLLIVVPLLAVACTRAVPHEQQRSQTDTSAIQEVFLEYKQALLDSDGAKAVELVDTETIALYDGLQKNALEMPREKLSQLDLVTKFIVLKIRQEYRKSEIEKLSGRELFVIGVERGWIDKSTVSGIDRLAKIKVESNKASASIPRVPNAALFHFVKESGQWKIAIGQLFGLVNAAMKQRIEESGLTDEQFILELLSSISSKKVDERILSGPLECPAALNNGHVITRQYQY